MHVPIVLCAISGLGACAAAIARTRWKRKERIAALAQRLRDVVALP